MGVNLLGHPIWRNIFVIIIGLRDLSISAKTRGNPLTWEVKTLVRLCEFQLYICIVLQTELLLSVYYISFSLWLFVKAGKKT